MLEWPKDDEILQLLVDPINTTACSKNKSVYFSRKVALPKGHKSVTFLRKFLFLSLSIQSQSNKIKRRKFISFFKNELNFESPYKINSTNLYQLGKYYDNFACIIITTVHGRKFYFFLAVTTTPATTPTTAPETTTEATTTTTAPDWETICAQPENDLAANLNFEKGKWGVSKVSFQTFWNFEFHFF